MYHFVDFFYVTLPKKKTKERNERRESPEKLKLKKKIELKSTLCGISALIGLRSRCKKGRGRGRGERKAQNPFSPIPLPFSPTQAMRISSLETFRFDGDPDNYIGGI